MSIRCREYSLLALVLRGRLTELCPGMVATISSPLNSRTFMNLLITRRLPTMPMDLPPGWHTNHPPPPCRQFIIITLPVDRPSSPDTSTPSTPTSPLSPSSERSLDSPSHSKSTGGKEKTVRARYVSVEWVKEVDLQLTGFEHGEVDGGPRVVRGVEWAMATSSSAGGQSLGVKDMTLGHVC